MPFELSIIVPVLNESATIVKRLHALKETVSAHCIEIIVVDGGSTDNTADLAALYADKVLQSAKGRAVQMNTGAAQASASVLLFLHIDTHLPKQLPLELSSSGDQWGFYPVKLSGSHPFFRVIEFMMNLRSRLSYVATGDQCLFVQTALFKQIKGFADIPLMEDIEISKRLRRVSAPYIMPTPVVTSSRHWERRGIVKTVLLMWYLRGLYFMGVPASRLVKYYYH